MHYTPNPQRFAGGLVLGNGLVSKKLDDYQGWFEVQEEDWFASGVITGVAIVLQSLVTTPQQQEQRSQVT